MNAPVPKSTALLALTIATLVVFPLSLRAVNRMVVSETPPPGYLPSLELRRPREPFQQQVVDRLRYGTPAWVFISDSRYRWILFTFNSEEGSRLGTWGSRQCTQHASDPQAPSPRPQASKPNNQ